eukprot:m.163024 g.163024  ORF g.163024 m.163024 type:complete len:429 (+) comp24903_c0_seq6:1081-2367(+)
MTAVLRVPFHMLALMAFVSCSTFIFKVSPKADVKYEPLFFLSHCCSFVLAGYFILATAADTAQVLEKWRDLFFPAFVFPAGVFLFLTSFLSANSVTPMPPALAITTFVYEKRHVLALLAVLAEPMLLCHHLGMVRFDFFIAVGSAVLAATLASFFLPPLANSPTQAVAIAVLGFLFCHTASTMVRFLSRSIWYDFLIWQAKEKKNRRKKAKAAKQQPISQDRSSPSQPSFPQFQFSTAPLSTSTPRQPLAVDRGTFSDDEDDFISRKTIRQVSASSTPSTVRASSYSYGVVSSTDGSEAQAVLTETTTQIQTLTKRSSSSGSSKKVTFSPTNKYAIESDTEDTVEEMEEATPVEASFAQVPTEDEHQVEDEQQVEDEDEQQAAEEPQETGKKTTNRVADDFPLEFVDLEELRNSPPKLRPRNSKPKYS